MNAVAKNAVAKNAVAKNAVAKNAVAKNSAPVITIDGPSGAGKGTVCQSLAGKLKWHLLDSGALYRIVGMAVEKEGCGFDDPNHVAKMARSLDVAFLPGAEGEPATVMLNGEDITSELRTEAAGANASLVGAMPPVRDALLELQKSFAKAPGLVADGRDMGTVVFPDAALKIYLTASAEERAERRYKQLIANGKAVSMRAVLEDVQARDERDSQRKVAPLKPADDAIIVDSTGLGVAQVIELIEKLVDDTVF